MAEAPAVEERRAPETGPGSPTAAASLERGPLVVFLGDSISAGLHLEADRAFPALLQERLSRRGVPFRLVNAGVSGDTTAGGLRRLDWLLRQEPDWVVVELGGNDGLRGIELASIEENLRAILAKVEAAGANAALLGMKLPPNYGPDYIAGFEEIFARVAGEADVPFVPFFLEGVGGDPELNLPDGIHPTEEGHRRVADFLEPFFLELLAEG